MHLGSEDGEEHVDGSDDAFSPPVYSCPCYNSFVSRRRQESLG